jgi:hypothetical protein
MQHAFEVGDMVEKAEGKTVLRRVDVQGEE